MNPEPSIVIVGRNRGGRPRKFTEETCPVSSRVPVSDADALMKLASYNGETVGEFVRGLIQKAVRPPVSY